MFSSLFSNKQKNTSTQKLSSSNKEYLYNLERLLSDLGITFFNKRSIDHTAQLVKQKKGTVKQDNVTLAPDAQKIAMNQLLYSQIMEEKMRTSSFINQKSKAFVLQR